MLTPKFLSESAAQLTADNVAGNQSAPSTGMPTDDDRSEATVLFNAIPNVESRCEIASTYIHAIGSSKTGFLVTNIAPTGGSQTVAPNGTRWLVGRNQNCVIVIHHKTVSRHHAEILYQPGRGFSITDLGSNNGTRVNFRNLSPRKSHLLQDGDVIEIGRFQLEFFVTNRDGSSSTLSSEMTRY